MNNPKAPTRQQVEATLTEATAQLVAANLVLSAPKKFTKRELDQAKEHLKASQELLEPLGYDTSKVHLIEPSPSVPSFLVTLGGKDAGLPRKDDKAGWTIPAGCYIEVLEQQYPSYKN